MTLGHMPDPPPGSINFDADDAGTFTQPRAAGADPATPPPGPEPTRLGVYAIKKKLGEGGMGAVYLATDARLNRDVAVKVMRPEIAAQPTARARFLREAQAMAAVNHDHVATIYAASEEPDGTTWLAMELLEGESLEDALKSRRAFDWPGVLRVGREVALGLAAAHAKKLIHRDIKPANVWLEAPGGRVKILDFGLVRPADADSEMTGAGALIGTPAYMAPEQADGGPVDHRADLFSLGVLLYRLATGKSPFAGPTVLATLVNVTTQDPTPVAALRPDCPPGLADLIHRLLAKTAADRPPTAKAVADELLRLEREDSRTPLTLPPKPERPPAPAGAGKKWLLAVPALLLLLAGGFVVLKQMKKDDPEPDPKVTDPPPVVMAPADKKAPPAADKGKPAVVVVPDAKDKPPAVTPAKTLSAPLPASFTNALGMAFVKVPKGAAWLGGGDGAPGGTKVEFPRDIYVGQYEVTQEEWEKVTGKNPSQFSRTGDNQDAVKAVADEDLKRFPVENVSWDDAQAFLTQLNKKEPQAGWTYRLPTSQEWEYACRGGPSSDKAASAFNFYFAKPTNELAPGQANILTGKGDDPQRPAKVGSYRPNPLGLYDMAGNVNELCDNLYSPADTVRATRGGGWLDTAFSCRCSFLGACGPGDRRSTLGVRVVLVPVKE